MTYCVHCTCQDLVGCDDIVVTYTTKKGERKREREGGRGREGKGERGRERE